MRAACGKRVQPEPAASQFRKHSLLTNYALGLACGGLRRPAVVSMRSYVRNTKSADAIVPMALDKTNACQHSDCAHVREGHHSVTVCAVSSRTRKIGSKTLYYDYHRTVPQDSSELEIDSSDLGNFGYDTIRHRSTLPTY